ncbi:hypothetical protein MHU86_22202 [Fragilaria crotonensis]|nr:hypothetical protein MHU86_22202 [Fragilaria crotonensis]
MSSSTVFTSDVIPETLLALAKDERYVRQCHELLKAILPGDSCPAGLSWLLYSLLVVRRTNKTLGMEFCGLSVTNDTSASEATPGETIAGNDVNNNRLWKLMALSSVVSIAIEWHFSKPDRVQATDATASNALRGRERQLFHQRQRQAMLQRATETAQESNVVSESTGNSSITNEAGSGTLDFRALLRKVKDVVKSTLLDLSVSTVAQEGPHRVVTTRQGTETRKMDYSTRHGALFNLWKLSDLELVGHTTEKGPQQSLVQSTKPASIRRSSLPSASCDFRVVGCRPRDNQILGPNKPTKKCPTTNSGSTGHKC